MNYAALQNLNATRFERERRLYNDLLQRPEIRQLSEQVRANNQFELELRRLRLTALMVTESGIPWLMEPMKKARAVTALENRAVEMYVYNDSRLNAACLDEGRKELVLMLSSTLVERFSEAELLFVIGHELGHALYKHNVLPVQAMLAHMRHMPPLFALMLLAWSRSAEISADRVGLLCCGDLNVATQVMLKLASGITIKSINANALAEQIRMVEKRPELMDATDWFVDHPFNPLRVAALSEFGDSALFGQMLHAPNKSLPMAEVDRRIHEKLALVEPFDPTAEISSQAESPCLLWGGLWVASADGQFHQNELQNIYDMFGPQVYDAVMLEIGRARNPVAHIQQEFYRAAESYKRSPLVKRQGLVQQLVGMALADGRIDERERLVLYEICARLEVNPFFVERTLLQYL